MVFGENKISYDNLLELNNVGILIVDMQEDFIDYIGNDRFKKLLINSQLKLLSDFREKQVPLVMMYVKGEGQINENIIRIFSQFKNNLILDKKFGDSFSNKKVLSFFKKNKVKNLIIMGLNASLCVRDTINSALKNDFIVFTSSRLIMDGDNIHSKWWSGKTYINEILNPYNNKKCFMIDF